MHSKTHLVVTSISHPNSVLKKLSEGCKENGINFILIGDTKSPVDFQLEGCDFWSIERQKSMDFKLTSLIPEKHYTRKNLGYLQAMKEGSEVIIETDDDNFPLPGFWEKRSREKEAYLLENQDWVNIYRYYADVNIWPRGFPLDKIQNQPVSLSGYEKIKIYAPIQQGLADDNPDVDAIYRLVLPLPVKFQGDFNVALGAGSWCPFNSQNTTWFRKAFPLMYLPSYCSFRMTDIWRSL